MTSCDLLANIGNFHAFAKCIVHRCVHYVGTLQRFLWLTEISETRIPAISKTCLSDKEIEKREIKPKPPRRRRLCCPPPLLPAAPSRRQTLSQSLLFPPPPSLPLPLAAGDSWGGDGEKKGVKVGTNHIQQSTKAGGGAGRQWGGGADGGR